MFVIIFWRIFWAFFMACGCVIAGDPKTDFEIVILLTLGIILSEIIRIGTNIKQK